MALSGFLFLGMISRCAHFVTILPLLLLPITAVAFSQQALKVIGCVYVIFFCSSLVISKATRPLSEWLESWMNFCVTLLLFCFPLRYIPDWFVSLFGLLVESSSILWCAGEVLAFLYLLYVASNFLTQLISDESTELIAKISMLTLSCGAYFVSLAILVWLFNRSDWICFGLLPLVVTTHYLVLTKDSGTILDASMTLAMSLLSLYAIHYEMEMHDLTMRITENIKSVGLDWQKSSLVMIIWNVIFNLYEYMTVNLRLWLQILTPLTAASLVLRMIFMQILHDFGQTGNDMTDTKDSDFEADDNDDWSVSAVLQDLLRNHAFHQLLLMLLVTHLLYRNIDVGNEEHGTNNSSHQETYSYAYRTLQSFSIQIIYIYYLYQCDDD